MTDTETVETTHGAICDIRLNRLKKSQRNARKTPHAAADIEALAASISVKGMLQMPVVEPEYEAGDQPTGFYLVTIGEGRRLAQLLRVKRKEIKKTELIRCMIDTNHDAHEISLDENVTRAGMHPADQFEAFERLSRERGYGPEEIAARFGVTAAVVRQRLRLATISPRLIEHYRKAEMSLEQVMAFTVTEDHARQEALWEALAHGYREPRDIRAHLTRDRVSGRDRRAVFVGAEAYQAAGGVVERDLFADDFGGYFTDPALLDRLALEKLEEAAARIEAEGWKWAMASIETPNSYALARLTPSLRDLTPEEDAQEDLLYQEENDLPEGEWSEEAEERYAAIQEARGQLQADRLFYSPEEQKRAGAFISLSREGEIRIDYGFIRAEDQPVVEGDAFEEVGESEEQEQTPPERPTGRGALSDALVSELTAHRTLALRDALARRPETALIYLVHAFVYRFFDLAYRARSCLEVRPNSTALAPYAKGVFDTPAGDAVAARQTAWAARIAQREETVIAFLADLSQDDLLSLLAHCVSLTVNGVKTKDQPWTGEDPADALAQALSLDMLTYWTPTAATYFNRVSKARILEAVTEARGAEQAAPLIAAKKDVMADAAEDLVRGTGWMPEPLRNRATDTVPVALAAEWVKRKRPEQGSGRFRHCDPP